MGELRELSPQEISVKLMRGYTLIRVDDSSQSTMPCEFMTRKELYEINCRWTISQMTTFVLKISKKILCHETSLTFLIDDILRTMAINQELLCLRMKENAKDGRDHYYFEIDYRVGCRSFHYKSMWIDNLNATTDGAYTYFENKLLQWISPLTRGKHHKLSSDSENFENNGKKRLKMLDQ